MPIHSELSAWLDGILLDSELSEEDHITSVAIAHVGRYENGELAFSAIDVAAYVAAHRAEIITYISRHPSRV